MSLVLLGTSVSSEPLWIRNKQSALSRHWKESPVATILWIIAAILVISGIFAIFRKQMLWGIVLIVVGLLVGPGGVSIFH
jgi:hypothetical protein